MSFFGPTSSPLLDESSAPMIRRALHRARIVSGFAFAQGAVQLIGFLSGILLVRTLDQREYAYFTIANTMQGTINVLADIGISIGLVSIGGRVWQDRERFGQLINTGLRLRRTLGHDRDHDRHAAPLLHAGEERRVSAVRDRVDRHRSRRPLDQLSIGVLSVVPRLHSNIKRIQAIDLTGAIARLIVLIALVFVFLNASAAILVGAAALVLQWWLLRRYVVTVVDLGASENAEDRGAMLGFIRNQAANAIFFCLQGQITIFLISFFGTRASSVAEVGALGRLAMIFAVISNLLTNVFAPAFARCQSPRRLRWQFAGIIGAVAPSVPSWSWRRLSRREHSCLCSVASTCISSTSSC
jgi:hypothetical protein